MPRPGSERVSGESLSRQAFSQPMESGQAGQSSPVRPVQSSPVGRVSQSGQLAIFGEHWADVGQSCAQMLTGHGQPWSASKQLWQLEASGPSCRGDEQLRADWAGQGLAFACSASAHPFEGGPAEVVAGRRCRGVAGVGSGGSFGMGPHTQAFGCVARGPQRLLGAPDAPPPGAPPALANLGPPPS